MLDPGGFGAITITKSITIDGSGGAIAGVLVSGQVRVACAQAPDDASAADAQTMRAAQPRLDRNVQPVQGDAARAAISVQSTTAQVQRLLRCA